LVALTIQPVYTVVHADAPEELFAVGDIRIEGLQRISEGTVFNYLPVRHRRSSRSPAVGEAMRALYATGFFREVELRRDGNTLLVVVIRTPVDRQVRTQGQQGHQDRGSAEEPAQRGAGHRQEPSTGRCSTSEAYLTDQYFSRGKVRGADRHQDHGLARNKVDVIVDIKEGQTRQD